MDGASGGQGTMKPFLTIVHQVHSSNHKPARQHTYARIHIKTGWKAITHLLTHPSTDHLTATITSLLLTNPPTPTHHTPLSISFHKKKKRQKWALMEIQLICPHSPGYHPIKSPFQSPLDEEEIGVKVTSFWMRRARLYNWKHSDVRLSLSQVKKKKKTDWPAFPGVSARRWMFENESNHFTEAEMGWETTISSDCSSCGRIDTG